MRYNDWLSNLVVIKMKSSKWRVYVDFTDFNKAFPKDSFPLPRIEMLSFMDAFSCYNQIVLHPDDREKITFIIDMGTYCYKVMPFGWKNAETTYQ